MTFLVSRPGARFSRWRSARRSRSPPRRPAPPATSMCTPGANFKPVTIAVTPLAGDEGATKIGAVLANDLAHSIFLTPLNPSTFPETIANPDAAPEYRRLEDGQRAIRADRPRRAPTAAMSPRSSGCGTSRPASRSRASNIRPTPPNARRIAHLIADAVFTRVTGEKGFFDSRVVFVDETGSKEKRRKRIALMDMDGANVKYLTSGDKLVVTPRFSPSAQQVAYMSFGERRPEGDAARPGDPASASRSATFAGMTFSPRFSPDGQHIVMSLSEGADVQPLRRWISRSRATTPADRRPARSTPRRPIRPTARRSCSNPTAAARSRSM